MNIEPTENELNKLQEAISYLADLISEEVKPNKSVLEEIVLKVGLNNHHDWINNILECACPILEKAHNDIHGVEKEVIIAELERLGIKKFPAILTYDKAKSKPPSSNQQRIDFLKLKLGIGENFTLKVTGGSVLDILFSEPKRLKELYGCSGAKLDDKSKEYFLERLGIVITINWITAKDSSTAVRIQVIGRLPGKSLDDYITIVTNRGSITPIPISIVLEKTEIIEKPEVTEYKEPPLLSRCPKHDSVVKKPCLFYNKYTQRYECFYGKEVYPYPSKEVTDYNSKHR